MGAKEKGYEMTLRIKELPLSERPYEKLEMYGAKTLSNSELLAIIIKSGTKEETSIGLAHKILNLKGDNQVDDLRFMQEISIDEFMQIKGIGKVKAIQLKAVCELAKRMSRPINNLKAKIRTSQDVADLFMEELRYEKREVAKVIILNIKNIILKIVDISIGGTNYAILEPREVLLEAIKMQAPKIVLIHNHPSGDPTPSKQDYQATDRIYEAANILGIELLDHIIIGDGKYESLLEKRKSEWGGKNERHRYRLRNRQYFNNN